MNWRFDDPAGEWREQIIDGSVVRYLVTGEGAPVILIHGLSGSVRWWSHNIGELSRSFRVYALDLLEYHPQAMRRRFILPEAARRIALWMESIGLKSASLIGHSMGGAIAAELAADSPGRVERLVLVNAAAALPKARVPISLPNILLKAPHFSPTLVPILIQDAWRTGPRVLWGATRDLFTADFRPKLRQIRAETLIIWGQHDGILSPSLGEEIRQLVPNCKLKILPRSGHNPMWEQPAEFNALVREFLGAPM